MRVRASRRGGDARSGWASDGGRSLFLAKSDPPTDARPRAQSVSHTPQSYRAGVAPRSVTVVPHTHWDREWYLPFQGFRHRLVHLLDELLDQLDHEPDFRHFLLDGQMAVVDDYLAVRPHEGPRLKRLAADGRVAMGPWYALPDEFLVSGETLVRNLQAGMRRAEDFGGAMSVGYLPDMFGHVAQMPQILEQLGFAHAVVWRGVPAAVDRSGFRWEAPDGSVVRAEYLPQGYGNGASTPRDPAALVTQVGEWAETHGAILQGAPILWMNGSDHLMPQPWVAEALAEANELQDDWRFEIGTLAEHLATAPTEDLPHWKGELRSGARANLLMGVTSNRTDVRQAAQRAEQAVERLAEPLSALLLPAQRWPATLLGESWLHLIRNSAHDSVCACSADEVVDAVLVRYLAAQRTAEGLVDDALAALGAEVGGSAPLVVNPTARTRSGLVSLDLPGDGGSDPELGIQVLKVRPAVRELHTLPADVAAVVVPEELAWTVGVVRWEVEEPSDGEDVDESGAALVVHVHLGEGPRPGLAPLGDRLRAHAADRPDVPVRVVTHQGATRRVLVHLDAVPGFGWKAWGAEPTRSTPVTADGNRLANGRITVEVDGVDGTWSIDGHRGLGRLVDGGDVGDTYNWCPPADDHEVTDPIDVQVEVLESGPVRGRIAIERTYRWPERAEGGARAGSVEATVRTTLELQADEDVVRVTEEVDNRARDHRLRVHLPLPQPATSSFAECAYDVVERGLVAEGGLTEAPLATYPSRRFVVAGGLTVVHEGLNEYELLLDGEHGDDDVAGGDDGEGPGPAHTLALTLLRCTGMLSQGPMATRPLPAGPLDRLEGPQLQGRHVLRYAVRLGEHEPHALADQVLLPLLVAPAAEHRGGPATAAEGRALEVSGAEVAAVLRQDERLAVRVFNPTDAEVVVRLPGRTGEVVDLTGRPLEAFEDWFTLRPHGIATALLTDA